jgi:hypothetical protein
MIEPTYNSPWKSYLNIKFKPNINEVLYHNLMQNSYPEFTNKCYNELFTVWAQIHCNAPKNNEDM